MESTGKETKALTNIIIIGMSNKNSSDRAGDESDLGILEIHPDDMSV